MMGFFCICRLNKVFSHTVVLVDGGASNVSCVFNVGSKLNENYGNYMDVKKKRKECSYKGCNLVNALA